MTQNTVIWTPKSVDTPFCPLFSQICCTTVFATTNSTGLSDLTSARGLTLQTCLLYPLVREASRTAVVSYRMRCRTLRIAASCLLASISVLGPSTASIFRFSWLV